MVRNNDPIHPQHYIGSTAQIEPIELCRPFPFTFGNFIKYVLRAPLKGCELDDYRKAKVYLEWAIEDLWRFNNTMREYAHIAQAYHNYWLDLAFYGNDYESSLMNTLEALKKHIAFLESNPKEEIKVLICE